MDTILPTSCYPCKTAGWHWVKDGLQMWLCTTDYSEVDAGISEEVLTANDCPDFPSSKSSWLTFVYGFFALVGVALTLWTIYTVWIRIRGNNRSTHGPFANFRRGYVEFGFPNPTYRPCEALEDREISSREEEISQPTLTSFKRQDEHVQARTSLQIVESSDDYFEDGMEALELGMVPREESSFCGLTNQQQVVLLQ